MMQPYISNEVLLYDEKDIASHGGNLVTEASATLLNGKIYVATGSGHVYGYNIDKRTIDWDFYIGADLDGTPPVTNDSCLLVSFEKEYIKGKGGVFKINPSKSPDKCVEWFFPTKNKKYFTWAGGIIGSVAVNDSYVENNQTHIAAFTGIDGYLYVVNHQKLSGDSVKGPNLKYNYPLPELLYKEYVGPSIASPIIVQNRIVVPTYQGLYLFGFDEKMQFELLDKFDATFEASPIAWNNRIFIASNGTGYLYCLGEK